MFEAQQMVFYGLLSLGSLYLIFLLHNQNYDNPLKDESEPISTMQRKLENPNDLKVVNDSPIASEQIQQVLELQRRLITQEMEGYPYPNGSQLDDFVLEKGGRPIRSIVLSTWRSGSTFFGDILSVHPGTFHYYEPLSDFGVVEIRGPPLAAEALENVKALLNCEYGGLNHYLEFGKSQSWIFEENTALWKQCQAHESICYNSRFVSGMCKLFPFQSMKLIRLRLRILQELLADEKLSVKLVLLVRDPRGTIQSRKSRPFCQKSTDCSDPALLCADMVSDYNVAVELQNKYPTTFKMVRYEDLSVEPYKYVEELTQFYGLDFHAKIQNFLDTHTKGNMGDVYSTTRDSKSAPFHWRTDLEFEEVEKIQQSCAVAMNQWGYVPAMDATHQREFNPVTNYVLDL